MADRPKLDMHGRDHRPGGHDPIPGLTAGPLNWVDFTLLNGAVDSTTVITIPDNPKSPPQYAVSHDGTIYCRGYVTPGDWDTPSLQFDTDVLVPFSQDLICTRFKGWYQPAVTTHSGSPVSWGRDDFVVAHVTKALTNSQVIFNRPKPVGWPYLTQVPEPKSPVSSGDPIGTALSGATTQAWSLLNQQWSNALSDKIGYYGTLTANEFGLRSTGASPGPDIAVNNWMGPFADGEVSVLELGTTQIGLSGRVQLPFLASDIYPQGVTLRVAQSAGGTGELFIAKPGGIIGQLVSFTSPGYTGGDVIGLSMIGQEFVPLLNGAPMLDNSSNPIVMYDDTYRSGHLGVGLTATSGSLALEGFGFVPMRAKANHIDLTGIVLPTSSAT